MSGEFDKVKGKVKEVRGKVLNDDSLKAKGKAEQVKGEAEKKQVK
ncbi:hypothetical protein FM106_01810 [Brachybacterium faecium]|nr:hypothetical protein FM106_01810 [Brachybacterium faecium]